MESAAQEARARLREGGMGVVCLSRGPRRCKGKPEGRLPKSGTARGQKLHCAPLANLEVIDMDTSEIVDTFWDEYSNFDKRRGDFADVVKYATEDVRAGRSHKWHEKYSLPYTKVLGHVACRVCSKLAGIGAAERSWGWGDVKHIKSGKRSHISVASIEKRAILYTSARVTESRIRNSHMEKVTATGPNALFGDDDMK